MRKEKKREKKRKYSKGELKYCIFGCVCDVCVCARMRVRECMCVRVYACVYVCLRSARARARVRVHVSARVHVRNRVRERRVHNMSAWHRSLARASRHSERTCTSLRSFGGSAFTS